MKGMESDDDQLEEFDDAESTGKYLSLRTNT